MSVPKYSRQRKKRGDAANVASPLVLSKKGVCVMCGAKAPRKARRDTAYSWVVGEPRLASSPTYHGFPLAEPPSHECEWPRFGQPPRKVRERESGH